MENDSVQAAIEQAAPRFSAEDWWASLPVRYRTAAVFAELQKLDAEVVWAALQQRAGQASHSASAQSAQPTA